MDPIVRVCQPGLDGPDWPAPYVSHVLTKLHQHCWLYMEVLGGAARLPASHQIPTKRDSIGILSNRTDCASSKSKGRKNNIAVNCFDFKMHLITCKFSCGSFFFSRVLNFWVNHTAPATHSAVNLPVKINVARWAHFQCRLHYLPLLDACSSTCIRKGIWEHFWAFHQASDLLVF